VLRVRARTLSRITAAARRWRTGRSGGNGAHVLLRSTESESLVFLGPSSGSCSWRTGISPGEGTVMKNESLKDALRLIGKVQSDPRLRPDQGDQLRRAKRELQVVARSGKFDAERVCRVVETVVTVLLEIVEDRATRRSK